LAFGRAKQVIKEGKSKFKKWEGRV
jgi:hypothetical protein